jgi:hypothetical protein
MKETIRKVLAKCTHFDKRTWYGDLLPTEVLALYRDGAKFNDRDVARAAKLILSGEMGKWSSYFTPTEDQLKVLLERKKAAARA